MKNNSACFNTGFDEVLAMHAGYSIQVGGLTERKLDRKRCRDKEREIINAYHHTGSDGVLAMHAGQGVGVHEGPVLVVDANITLICQNIQIQY